MGQPAESPRWRHVAHGWRRSHIPEILAHALCGSGKECLYVKTLSDSNSNPQLGQEIAKKAGIEGKGVMTYLNPIMIPYTRRHVSLEYRREHVMKPEDLTFKVFDVAGHRVYAVLYNPAQMFGIMESWGQPGIGISIRGAEELLKGVDTMAEVPFELDNLPAPTFTPESWAHAGLRDRINELVHRAAIDPTRVTCQPKDVFLFPTGMAAVYHTTNLLLEQRPGTAVVLGVVFHNTHHHLHEESPNGFKHFGKVDEEGIDDMESWLEEEKGEARPVSFAIVEFPGNPTLDSVNLHRLKKLVRTPPQYYHAHMHEELI
jgi:cystathionine gamma-synthase